MHINEFFFVNNVFIQLIPSILFITLEKRLFKSSRFNNLLNPTIEINNDDFDRSNNDNKANSHNMTSIPSLTTSSLPLIYVKNHSLKNNILLFIKFVLLNKSLQLLSHTMTLISFPTRESNFITIELSFAIINKRLFFFVSL